MKNEQLNDFQEKFLLFQECVLAWLSELDEDLLRVKASVKSPSSQDHGATNRNKREVKETPVNNLYEIRSGAYRPKSEQAYFEERLKLKRKTNQPEPAA